LLGVDERLAKALERVPVAVRVRENGLHPAAQILHLPLDLVAGLRLFGQRLHVQPLVGSQCPPGPVGSLPYCSDLIGDPLR
jgi:hypothetical protein